MRLDTKTVFVSENRSLVSYEEARGILGFLSTEGVRQLVVTGHLQIAVHRGPGQRHTLLWRREVEALVAARGSK